MKRKRQTQRDGKEQRKRVDKKDERDRLSDLPDCVLLHVMSFLYTKDAVQTCILSKRWKDLWKSLTKLTLYSSHFGKLAKFKNFVSGVLSQRDDSISVLNLDLVRNGFVEPKLFNMVIEYAVLHNVQELTIHTQLSFRPNVQFCPNLFSCGSITDLSLGFSTRMKLPKSLQMPALKNLILENITLSANDNDCVEPFSTCKRLNTLNLSHCYLEKDAKSLFISNSNLSTLSIDVTYMKHSKIILFTPNLSSLDILHWTLSQLSSVCNLPSLNDVYIVVNSPSGPNWTDFFLNLSWLPVIFNAKILILCSCSIKAILKDLSYPDSRTTQPPCFVRLETLIVKTSSEISHQELNYFLVYLLQNSPNTEINVINC